MRATEKAQVDVNGLVINAQQGNASAFAALYEHFFDQIFRYVSFKIGNSLEAEDLTGEVFIRMLESIKSFKPKGHPFSSWLFRIAHNLVVDYFRRMGKRKTVVLDVVESTAGHDPTGDIDRHVDQGMVMEEVYKAMGGLTNLQKEVISLRFAAGLSVAETARAVGKNDNAVKALQHAGLNKLRKLLDKQSALSSNPVFPMGYQEES